MAIHDARFHHDRLQAGARLVALDSFEHGERSVELARGLVDAASIGDDGVVGAACHFELPQRRVQQLGLEAAVSGAQVLGKRRVVDIMEH